MRVAILTANGWEEVRTIKGAAGVLILEEPLQLNVGDLVQLVEDQIPDPAETRALNALGLLGSGPPYLAAVDTKPPAPRNRAERRAARRGQ